jgi:hypothetical protein
MQGCQRTVVAVRTPVALVMFASTAAASMLFMCDWLCGQLDTTILPELPRFVRPPVGARAVRLDIATPYQQPVTPRRFFWVHQHNGQVQDLFLEGRVDSRPSRDIRGKAVLRAPWGASSGSTFPLTAGS